MATPELPPTRCRRIPQGCATPISWGVRSALVREVLKTCQRTPYRHAGCSRVGLMGAPRFQAPAGDPAGRPGDGASHRSRQRGPSRSLGFQLASAPTRAERHHLSGLFDGRRPEAPRVHTGRGLERRRTPLQLLREPSDANALSRPEHLHGVAKKRWRFDGWFARFARSPSRISQPTERQTSARSSTSPPIWCHAPSACESSHSINTSRIARLTSSGAPDPSGTYSSPSLPGGGSVSSRSIADVSSGSVPKHQGQKGQVNGCSCRWRSAPGNACRILATTVENSPLRKPQVGAFLAAC